MQVDADIFLNRYLAFLKVLFSYFTTEDGKLLTLRIIFDTYINSMTLSVLLSSQVLRIVEIITLIQICLPLALQVALHNLINSMFEVTNI